MYNIYTWYQQLVLEIHVVQIREKIRKELEYKEIEINAVLVQEKIRN